MSQRLGFLQTTTHADVTLENGAVVYVTEHRYEIAYPEPLTYGSQRS
jgi:hypothetical protein